MHLKFVRPLLFLAVAVLACSGAHAQLVGYWNFDNNVLDQSGNGNDGTIVGGVTYDPDVPTEIGSGMSGNFDGLATYVNVTHNQMLPITTQSAFSISMWVKGDGTVDNIDDRVFSESSSTSNSPLFNLGTKNDGADGTLDVYIRPDAGGAFGHTFSTGEPFDGSWHHIAWVDINHVGTLYVDGVEDSTFDYANVFNAGLTVDVTTFGGIAREGGANVCCNFTGQIDEVAIYSTPLSAGNVASLADGADPTSIEFGFPTLSIDRDTGEMTFTNGSESARVLGYSMRSTVGALNPGGWTSIAENYDADGDQSVDPDDTWVELTSPLSRTDLSEFELGGSGPNDGALIGSGQMIAFGDGWIQQPTEDISMTMKLDDGTNETVFVEFVGNNDMPFEAGDFNFDTQINEDDYLILVAGLHTDLSALSGAEAYGMGDMNGDSMNNYTDTQLFRAAFDAANGSGSFAAMVAGAPEPSSLALFGLGGAALLFLRRGRFMIFKSVRPLLALAVAVLICSGAQAELVGYWKFDNNVDDQSGNDNDGTIVGGVTYDADVPAALGGGMSANFDGVAGTYVNVTQNAMLPITTQSAFSISMWVKGDGTVDNADDRVFSEGMTTNNDPLFNLGTQNAGADGRFDFFFRNGGSPGHLYSVGEPFDGTWHHIAWVDSNHSGTLYIDGVEDTTFDYASFFNDGFAPDTTTFGGILRGSDCCNFTGRMDEVVIFSEVLSAGNVARLAAGADPTSLPPSVLTLEVNTDTGATRILNTTGDPIDINYYEITSDSGSLDPVGWNSLDDQNFGAIGSGVGESWDEAGGSDENILSEIYFSSSTNLADEDELSLGSAFDTAGQPDVEFSFGVTSGMLISGLVEYVTGGFLEADFDMDGDVDGDDFLAWQTGFGTPSGAQKSDGDYDNDGDVDGDDFLGWQTEFGSSSGNGATAVPEPSTLGLLGLVLAALAIGRSRHFSGGRMMKVGKHLLPAVAVVLTLTATAAFADVTNDRDYQLGDADPGASAGGNVAGSVDSAPPEVNNIIFGAGDPTYVDVGSGGAGRPGAGAGELGVEFDGSADYLGADRLGFPQTSVASSFLGFGTLDYEGIANRGFQLWVRPSVGASAEDQHIVMDTLQHGVGITASGNWFMQYAGSAHDTGVAVATGDWAHVMVVRPFGPSGPNGGSRFYLDGVAIGAVAGGYTGNQDDPFNLPVTLGANTGDFDTTFPGDSNFFTGILDNLEMFVMGTSTGGTEWGSFNAAEDNAFIADALSGLPDGDVDMNGVLDPVADVNAFVAGWDSQNLVNGIAVGDLNSRANGDLNVDGLTDLDDAYLLHEALLVGGFGGLPGFGVPEPTSAVLLLVGLLSFAVARQRDVR